MPRPPSTAQTLRCKGTGVLYSSAELRESAANPWLAKVEPVVRPPNTHGGHRVARASAPTETPDAAPEPGGWRGAAYLAKSNQLTASARDKKIMADAAAIRKALKQITPDPKHANALKRAARVKAQRRKVKQAALEALTGVAV